MMKGNLSKPSIMSLMSSGLRHSLILIIALVVISSPIVVFFNPMDTLAYSSVTDTSGSHATMPTGEISSRSISSPGSPTIQAPLQIPRTLQSNDLINSLAFYEVTFITSTTGAIDKIEMAFPSFTNIGAAGLIERIGIGGGTLTKAGTTLTYDLTTPVSIPAGTFIRLEMFGIKNPSGTCPGGVCVVTATITTRDSSGTVIDGPSQTNTYNIRQIGTSDIASGAVTLGKIADNTIQPFLIQRGSGPVSVAPNTVGTATANCNFPGETAVSGGYNILTRGPDMLQVAFEQVISNSYTVEAFNPGAAAQSFFAVVECMQWIP
jgi:hypothetical protein